MKNVFKFYLNALAKYAVFDGRASRQEFWGFWATHLSIFLLLVFFPVIPFLYVIGTFLPVIAVTVRRLHDVNRPGWWALPIITVFGSVIPFYFALQEGHPGANQYGINPNPGLSARIY